MALQMIKEKKMKKQINKELTLYFTNLFPYTNKIKTHKKYSIVLGIGGNIGKVKIRFNKLFLALKNDARFTVCQTSPILKNPPFGYLHQDDFLNAIIVIQTNLAPINLLNVMQRYEIRFGRIRSFKDAPRTLDIDILFMKKLNKNLKINHKRLTIPHLGVNHRDSVTTPMEYITSF